MNPIKDNARASDIAFTPAVKVQQERYGSRASYARMEEGNGWNKTVTADLEHFLKQMDSFYLGTTGSPQGHPYIQHRGGPKGFLKTLDEKTLAFADYSGNRQYITTGNLSENPKAFIFLMDYVNRRRIKIWGDARVVEDDPDLLAQVADVDYEGRPERVIVFTVKAWDANCPQHIQPRFSEEEIRSITDDLRSQVAELQAENQKLRNQIEASSKQQVTN